MTVQANCRIGNKLVILKRCNVLVFFQNKVSLIINIWKNLDREFWNSILGSELSLFHGCDVLSERTMSTFILCESVNIKFRPQDIIFLILQEATLELGLLLCLFKTYVLKHIKHMCFSVNMVSPRFLIDCSIRNLSAG